VSSTQHADFPPGFLWGAATAAHQVEGGNVNNDWWDFEHAAATAARESSGDGIDHLHRYAEDFALLKSLGHNAHRLSLEWSRIEPAPGEFSQAALNHYRRVLVALADTGLTGFVTLHHFTLPRWFAEQGGWLGPDAVTLFARYCRRVAAELGDLMPFVCTINEPQMLALHGYLEGYHPPGLTNPVLWKRVGPVLLDAHRAAVDAYTPRARLPGPGWRCSCRCSHPPVTTTPAARCAGSCKPRSSVSTWTGSPDPTAATGSGSSTTADNGSIRHCRPCSPGRRPARS
jgi:beta-glucosidase